MTLTNPDYLAARLASIRIRAGLTQKELAELSKVSLSTICKLEQDDYPSPVRLETLRKLAQALRVSTSTLAGDRGDPEQANIDVVTQWDPVRRALHGQLPQPDEPATAAGVLEDLQLVQKVFRAGRFADAVPYLPPLVRDAVALGTEGRDARCQVLTLAGWLATHTHQYKLADTAARWALDDAQDRADSAAVMHVLTWLQIRQGHLDDCHRVASQWADRLEPRRFSTATPHELGAWGWMLLREAMTSVRDNQPGGARDALRLAGAAAAAIGREIHVDGDWRRPFGPEVVIAKEAELMIVEDKPDKVLALAATIRPETVSPVSANWNRHLLDVAFAHAKLKDDAAALEVFEKLLRGAPQWLVEQRVGRDVLSYVISRRRKLTPQMRRLADAIRLPY